MINVYDFDKTIYDGDSTLDFYFYILKKKKKIIFLLPMQIYGFIVYKLKIKNKEYFKEKFFVFLKQIDNVDEYIDDFYNKNKNKIKKWYLNQKNDTDLIISASPEFLISKFCKELNVNYIATKVDEKNGKFLSKNCYGIEKVNRFQEEYKTTKINNFYSDSMSDKPMMNISKNSYLVKKDDIKKVL